MTAVAPQFDARRRPVTGMKVGILSLDTRHDLVLGNVQHAGSFDFPVAYAIVAGVPLPALMRGEEEALPPIVAGVERLEALGVDLIVGACGSFGHYQKDVARVAHVPVCLSILVQAPFVLALLPAPRKLGVIFARTASFTPRVKEQCRITDDSRIVAIGADVLPSFAPILDSSLPLDSPRLETDLVTLARDAQTRDPSIAAWLLQCSDLPPYAAALAAGTGLPVFDMLQLVHHLAGALEPRSFEGPFLHARSA